MPFQMFHLRCPEIGLSETRSLIVLPGQDNLMGVPPDEYAFIEQYCNERGCDCRRVFFNVVSRSHGVVLATIMWGWEDIAFYRAWQKNSPEDFSAELQGPLLAPLQATTELSEPLLEIFSDVLLADPIFIERIQQHYALFRRKVDRPKRTSKYD